MPRILLIDDNPDDRQLVVRELRDLPNLQLTQIANQSELDAALSNGGFDLAITDYMLRWSDGITVLRRLKARCGECPVIMFTGSGSEETAVEAMKQGLDDYITKTPKHYHRIRTTASMLLERAQRRKELAEAEDRYRLLFEKIPTPTFLFDLETRQLLAVNDAAVKHFGYTRHEFMALSLSDLDAAEDAGRWMALPEAEAVLRARQRRKDGSGVESELSLSRLRLAGKPVGLMSVVDVTERTRYEARLRGLNEELERRVAERTEQLRALTLELTMVEHRERRRIATDLHDNLAQTLAISKMKLSMIPPLPEGSEPAKLVREASDLLGRAIQSSRSLMSELAPPMLYDLGLPAALGGLVERMDQQYGLKVDLEPGADGQVGEGLRAYLFEAARELLINVVKYAGVNRAKMRLVRASQGVRLEVEDRGAGFDIAKLSWRPTETGGFGLFSLRERAMMLGGSLTINSAPGGGTRVAIDVPLRATTMGPSMDAALITPRHPERGVRPTPAAAGAVRVALVDDHRIIREGVANVLAGQTGIVVVGEAADGHAAVELIRKLRPDVVVMDVSMPRLNGVEATRIITRELPSVRVIGMSMHSEADMAQKMRDAGAVAYLTKDGPTETLVKTILEAARK